MIPASDLARWAEDAKKATQGEWLIAGATHVYAPGENGANICSVSEPRATQTVEYTRAELGSTEAYANARHIANASPANVLSLIAEVERLRAYAAHERSLGADAAMQQAQILRQTLERVDAALPVLATMCAKAKFRLGEQRAREMLEEVRSVLGADNAP